MHHQLDPRCRKEIQITSFEVHDVADSGLMLCIALRKRARIDLLLRCCPELSETDLGVLCHHDHWLFTNERLREQYPVRSVSYIETVL